MRTEMVGGNVETVTTYDPYGTLLAQAGTGGTPYGFTGERYDSAANLLYLRARYYNPYLNQFQSRDPFPGYAKLPQSQNGYSYVHNNPVNYVDPTGKMLDVGDRTGGGCSHANSTSCQQFMAEVQAIIDMLKQERECNPLLQILSEETLALDILAAYYSGIPFSQSTPIAGTYTVRAQTYMPGFIPGQTTFAPGTPDRWEVPTLDWAPHFEWNHPINDPNNDIGQSMRQEYGFKRPFFNQTHHYFAFLKFAYHLPDRLVWEYHKWAEIDQQLQPAYQEWQANIGQPREADYRQYYA